MIYILSLLFLSLIFFCFLDYVKVPYNAKFFVFLVFYVLLSLVAGFRAGDRDYDNYIVAYNEAPNWGSSSLSMEIGYRYLNLMFKYLGLSAQGFLILFAFISVGLMFVFFKRNTKFLILAVLIYFSHVFILRDMLQIRSSLSIGLAMLTIPYIENRKFWKTLLICLIASLFHFVGGLFILVYWIYPHLTKRRAIITITMGILIGFVVNEAFFLKILELTQFQLLYFYLADDKYNYSLGLLNPVLIKHLIVVLVVFCNFDKLKNRIPAFQVLFTSYVVAIVWLSAFNNFAIFAARVATLFSNVEHILIPSFLYLREYRAIALILIICYCLFSFLSKWEEIGKIHFFFN